MPVHARRSVTGCCAPTATMPSRSTTRPLPRERRGCASRPRHCTTMRSSRIWCDRCAPAGANCPCRSRSDRLFAAAARLALAVIEALQQEVRQTLTDAVGAVGVAIEADADGAEVGPGLAAFHHQFLRRTAF